MTFWRVLLILACLLNDGIDGLRHFGVQLSPKQLIKPLHRSLVPLHATLAIAEESNPGIQQFADRLFLPQFAQPLKLGPHIRIKGKTLNGWGILYALTTFSIAVVVLPFMLTLAALSDLCGNKKQRRPLDWLVHLWAQAAMRLSFCSPQVLGVQNLPPPGETVVYVPNHTSFIDILMMSGFVPRPFKYLSKSEIMNIPVVGWGMKLAKHVFLKRDDIKSTIEVSDRCIERLKDGNSMVLFAEGTRSEDGALRKFKKGAFQIAKAAGVRIVPVSIGNLHRIMPKSALLPIAPIRHTFIRIHPPIDPRELTVSQARILCQEAVNSGLPPYQQMKATLPGSSSSSSSTSSD